MSTESACEKEEGGLKHQWKTLDEEVKRRFLEPIEFALTVSATIFHRPARIPQVPIQPLLAQHGGKCGEQGNHKTRVHETGDGDDLARRAFLNRWNGGSLTRDGRLVESEEDRAEEGGRLVVRVRLEVRMDIDDKSRTDGRKQACL